MSSEFYSVVYKHAIESEKEFIKDIISRNWELKGYIWRLK